MSEITTAFYRGNTEVSVDFSAEGISSDGSVVLPILEKMMNTDKPSNAGAKPYEESPHFLGKSYTQLSGNKNFGWRSGYFARRALENSANAVSLCRIFTKGLKSPL